MDDGYGSSDGSADFEDLDDDEVWRAEDDGKGVDWGGPSTWDHGWLYTWKSRDFPMGFNEHAPPNLQIIPHEGSKFIDT